VNRHPGCQCPVGFDGPHCEFLSAERNPNHGYDAPTEHDKDEHDEEHDEENSNNGEGLSTAGIIFIVFFVDLLIVLLIGVYFYKKKMRQAEEERFIDPRCTTNLMGREAPEPPTLEHVLGMESMPDASESSLHSVRSGHSCSVNGDGLHRIDDSKSVDLVSVAII
jgi:hypothetical protein